MNLQTSKLKIIDCRLIFLQEVNINNRFSNEVNTGVEKIVNIIYEIQ